MARHYRVKSSFDPMWNGRIVIMIEGENDFAGCSHGPTEGPPGVGGLYLCEIVHRDDHVMGWEMTNVDEFFKMGWGDFEGPKALMYDPVWAPEGAQLKDLFRRVYERRGQAARPAGVGAT